jgi:cytochrome P450
MTPTNTAIGFDVLVDVVLLAAKNQNLDSWKKWFPSQEKGSNDTVETNLLGKRMIFTADPENIKAVLATQFQDYGKGEGFHKSWEAFLGDSIFTTDGDKWHTSRQLIRPLFIKDRVSDLDALEKHVQILYKTIEKENVIKGDSSGVLSYGRETQIGEQFFRYTLDVATEFMLGHSVQSLGNPKQPFEEAFEEIQRVQSVIARAGYVC